MRGEAAIFMALAAAGCGGLATSSDAPPSSDARADAPPGTPDAAACSYACYRQSEGGQPSAVGAAACRTPTDVCQPAFDWLEPIDLCSCSTGTPALYVLPDPGGTARVALIAPPSPTGFSVSMTDTDGQCYGAGACAGAACGNLEVSVWVNVQATAGQNRFTIYDDDGTGCANARYSFIVVP